MEGSDIQAEANEQPVSNNIPTTSGNTNPSDNRVKEDINVTLDTDSVELLRALARCDGSDPTRGPELLKLRTITNTNNSIK